MLVTKFRVRNNSWCRHASSTAQYTQRVRADTFLLRNPSPPEGEGLLQKLRERELHFMSLPLFCLSRDTATIVFRMSECLYSSTAREKVTHSEKLEHGEVGERKYRRLQHHSMPFPRASKWRRLVPKEASPSRERWNATVSHSVSQDSNFCHQER